MRLCDAPVGLFLFDDTLCMKTEYSSPGCGCEAYIVSSGEMFWGGAKSKEERQNLDVTPVNPENLRPHGRWIKKGPRCVCGECKQGIKANLPSLDIWLDLSTLPFCPFCGAMMDKEEDHA